MIPKLIAIGAALSLATISQAAEGPAVKDEGFGLACTGLMMAEGLAPPGSRIITNGVVDLVQMRVRGFGLGGATVVSVSEAEVRFGSSLSKTPSGGQAVEGTIDRLSGKTRIVVRSAKAPWEVLIEMNLDCRTQPRVVY